MSVKYLTVEKKEVNKEEEEVNMEEREVEIRDTEVNVSNGKTKDDSTNYSNLSENKTPSIKSTEYLANALDKMDGQPQPSSNCTDNGEQYDKYYIKEVLSRSVNRNAEQTCSDLAHTDPENIVKLQDSKPKDMDDIEQLNNCFKGGVSGKISNNRKAKIEQTYVFQADENEDSLTTKIENNGKIGTISSLPHTIQQQQSEISKSEKVPNVNVGSIQRKEPDANVNECKERNTTNTEQEADKVDVKTPQEKCDADKNNKDEYGKIPEKGLPDWFRMMIALTHGIHDGKEMKQTEDITETIDIHGSTQAITVRTNERLLQLIMKRLHRITRRQRFLCTCTPDFSSFNRSSKRKGKKDKELNHLVEDLLEPLVEIEDVNISCEDVNAVCHRGGVPVLHIRCTSCQSLYRVVTALNSPLFKDGIIRIKDCLEEEMKDKLKIDANITPESIHDIEHHLREQGIITGTDDFVSCGLHPDKLTEVYCFQHNDVCCMSCVESQHRSCDGVKHVTAEVAKRSVIIGKVKEYNVRLHTENGDEGNCDIIACCALPDGEIILADMNNKRLKKLNIDLKVIDHCDLPDCPRDVCYLGNNKLAVTLFDPGIQFVDISGPMELKEKVHLDHDCYGLTFYGDTLYITDPMTVFMYTCDGTEKGVLYKQIVGNHSFCKIAASDDGEKFYIAARDDGLVTIDKEGNRVSSFHKEDLRYVSDLCVACDGTVLTCNYRKQTVSRVDSNGKMMLGRVAERSNDMYMPQSLCYDRHGSRLIVGHLHDDFISVLNFK